ncbi:hypothetical protein DBR36_03545 [Microbacterium sp. HMWF026]|uniref:recombinase family protein n=1 Tax=Microbacterium sp. HMWF026 TaxID=2056861 RepID=UPI000D3C93DE|nr:recombinase family protein [Microbacterium sp. HMWF026]PTT21733.1 hypothetical protein DBR36_03545 [Microbacterium sp. HMWF026]
MTTAAIYTRISSDPGREGIGVEDQERQCRELAASKGLQVVEVYTDNDKGASEKTPSTKVRDDYNRMLADARAGNFRFVLAYTASRLTRRLEELDDFVKLAQPPYGVRVLTVGSGDDDLTTADGLMMARFKAVIDAGESHRISDRAKSSHLARARKGMLRRSPWRSFGFQEDGITHHPDEAALIKEAVDLIKGGAGLREVGRLWEKRGVKGTPVWKKGLAKGERVQRTEWSHSDVKEIVFRWKNVGIRARYGEPVVVDGEYVKGEWEPIYSLEDREAALEKINTNYVKPYKRSTKGVLSGILVCGKCGRNLYGNSGSGRANPFYVCTDGRKSHLGISAPALEEYVQRVVFRYAMERAYYGEEEAKKQLIPWPGEERLSVIAAKREELMAAYKAGALSGSIVFPTVEEFRIEEVELVKQRTQHYARQMPTERLIKHPVEAIQLLMNFHNEPIERRRVALRDELERIVIGPGEQGRRGHAAMVKRVEFEWKDPHPIFNNRTAEEAHDEPLMGFLVQEWAKKEGDTPPPREDREAYEKWLEARWARSVEAEEGLP